MNPVPKDLNPDLVTAAENGDLPEVIKLLQADADSQAEANLPLKRATKGGHTRVVEILLRAGADPLASPNGVIGLALDNEHIETARVLMRAGANVKKFENVLLALAAREERTKTLQFLIKETDANPHDCNHRALDWAIKSSKRESIKILLKTYSREELEHMKMHTEIRTLIREEITLRNAKFAGEISAKHPNIRL